MSEQEPTETFNPLEVLISYIKKQKPGAVLDYLSVQRDTRIDMQNQENRRLLKRAALKSGVVWESMRDIGIRLSSAENAKEIAQKGIVQISNKATKEQKKLLKMTAQHGAHIRDSDMQDLTRMGAFYGVIKVAIVNALPGVRKDVGGLPPPPALPLGLKKKKDE